MRAGGQAPAGAAAMAQQAGHVGAFGWNTALPAGALQSARFVGSERVSPLECNVTRKRSDMPYAKGFFRCSPNNPDLKLRSPLQCSRSAA